jgi:hypothetical protein
MAKFVTQAKRLLMNVGERLRTDRRFPRNLASLFIEVTVYKIAPSRPFVGCINFARLLGSRLIETVTAGFLPILGFPTARMGMRPER